MNGLLASLRDSEDTEGKDERRTYAKESDTALFDNQVHVLVDLLFPHRTVYLDRRPHDLNDDEDTQYSTFPVRDLQSDSHIRPQRHGRCYNLK